MNNISVHIHYYGVLSLYTRVKSEDLEIPDRTRVEEMLQILIKKNPGIYSQIIGDAEISRSALRIIRNEKLLAAIAFSDYVKNGDKFKLIPAVSGG